MTTQISGTTGVSKVQDASVTQAKLAPNVAGNGPAFSAYLGTTQTGITSGTLTKVLFDVETIDTNNNFAAARFTPTVPGYYQIDTAVALGAASVTVGVLVLRKNGVDYVTLSQVNNGGGDYVSFCGNALVFLNGSTDYIEVWVSILGTTPAINATALQVSRFSGFLARAA